MEDEMELGLKKDVQTGFDETRKRVEEALKEEGFGILTEIDMQKTLKQKLGIDMHRVVILGACNPKLAHRAYESNQDVAMLLPCNVVLTDRGSSTEVAILNPRTMSQLLEGEDLKKVAEEAYRKLSSVLERI